MTAKTIFARWLTLREASWYAPTVASVAAVVWGSVLAAAMSPDRRPAPPKPSITVENNSVTMPGKAATIDQQTVNITPEPIPVIPFRLTPLQDIPVQPVENPAWQKLNAELQTLKSKRETLLRSLTPRHPAVHAVDADILSVQETLQSTPKFLGHSASTNSDSAVVLASLHVPQQEISTELVMSRGGAKLPLQYALALGCLTLGSVVIRRQLRHKSEHSLEQIHAELGVPVFSVVRFTRLTKPEHSSKLTIRRVARWFGEGTIVLSLCALTAMVLFGGQSISRWALHPLATMKLCVSDWRGRIPRL